MRHFYDTCANGVFLQKSFGNFLFRKLTKLQKQLRFSPISSYYELYNAFAKLKQFHFKETSKDTKISNDQMNARMEKILPLVMGKREVDFRNESKFFESIFVIWNINIPERSSRSYFCLFQSAARLMRCCLIF